MKLDSLYRQPGVLHSHNLSVLTAGANFKLLGQGGLLGHQGVVAGEYRRRGNSAIDTFTVQLDALAFAVDNVFRLDNFSAQGVDYRLMAQTDSQDRHFLQAVE